MFNIGYVIVEDDIAGERFACDLNRCRGGCCTLHGGRGAPLLDEELPEIDKTFPHVRQFLSDEHLEIIRQHGMVEGFSGSYATVCVDQRACVFVYYDDDIARCAFERAFLMGITSWQKPLSCHLFPIRIRNGNLDHLHYERIRECATGRENGTILNISLVRFLRDALTRKYGEDWYSQVLSEGTRMNKSKDPVV
jgi:hypothetical protein